MNSCRCLQCDPQYGYDTERCSSFVPRRRPAAAREILSVSFAVDNARRVGDFQNFTTSTEALAALDRCLTIQGL